MQQRDYLLEEVKKIGEVMVALTSLLLGRTYGQIDSIKAKQDDLQELLGFDLLDLEVDWSTILQHRGVLARLTLVSALFKAKASEEALEVNKKLAYLSRALHCLEKQDELDAAISLTREGEKAAILDLIKAINEAK